MNFKGYSVKSFLPTGYILGWTPAKMLLNKGHIF